MNEKFMKIFLKILAVIILSLLIFFVGIFKYRQYQANQVSIPRNATSVLKISVDEMLKSLAANMVSNPGFYLKSGDKKKPKDGKSEPGAGLKIPASLYLYSLEKQPKTAVFTRFEVKSASDFETFIKHRLGFKILKQQHGMSFASSSLGNVIICYNTEAAAIAFSGEVVNFDAVLIDLLKQNDFVKLSESKFNKIKKSTHHIAYSDDNYNFTTDFIAGAINFNADFSTSAITPSANPKHRMLNAGSVVSMWLNADFPKTSTKTYRLKNATLERDSLLKYYKGYLDFEWTNSIKQTDSIVTYAYNDDFEKVEKITLQEKNIPNATFIVAADAMGLSTYLSRQKIINLDSATVNKSVFPLYKTFVGGNSQYLVLGTKKPGKVDSRNINSTDFFSLDINFKKLNNQLNVPGLGKYLKHLDRLTIKGKAVNPKQIQLDGKATLVNGDINSLYQLLKDF